MPDLVELEISDDVARLTLNRPDAANTLNVAVAEQFLQHVQRIRGEGARAVVVSGRGRTFCAGGDVRAMGEASDLGGFLDTLAGTFHRALCALAELDAVVIAVVDGAAAGGGLGLALNADLRIASPAARFLTAYETVGLTPDSGVSYLLPRAIGLGRATAMSAASLVLDADEAFDVGLVNEIVDTDRLASHVDELAARIARRPQTHMATTRRLLRGDTSSLYAAALDAERIALVRAASNPSTRSLIHGFASR